MEKKLREMGSRETSLKDEVLDSRDVEMQARTLADGLGLRQGPSCLLGILCNPELGGRVIA